MIQFLFFKSILNFQKNLINFEILKNLNRKKKIQFSKFSFFKLILNFQKFFKNFEILKDLKKNRQRIMNLVKDFPFFKSILNF